MGKALKEKYVLEGLDCAQCAANIERELNGIDGLHEVNVNFAAGSVAFDPAYEETVRSAISQIEPDVSLTKEMDQAPQDKPPSWYKEKSAARLGISLLLFLVGILFHNKLSNSPGQFGLYLVFLPAYAISGWPVLWGAVRNIVKGRVFDELFLMTIASVGALLIGEIPEATGVMIFFAVGSFVEDRAVQRSRRSITSLMDHRPDVARVVDGGDTREMAPNSVEIGATVEVWPGEVFPFDGEVLSGSSYVDTSALTGEPVIRSVGPGDDVMAGTLNDSGKLKIRTTKLFGESTAAKVLRLVEEAASRKAPPEKFISKFAAVYTPIVVVAAALVAVVPPLFFGQDFGDWLYRALVMLVISCPCALVVSIPLGYFGGIGRSSAAKVLVKGSNVIDALREVKTVVYDKTGTLTEGAFKVRKLVPAAGNDDETLLRAGSCAESISQHPIAESIRVAFGGEKQEIQVGESREEKGYGVVTDVDGTTYIAGSARHLAREGISEVVPEDEGTTVYVAADGRYIGMIVLSDEIKPEAKKTVSSLRELGIERQYMLTGDDAPRAKAVSSALDLDDYKSNLLPEDKINALSVYSDGQRQGLTMFVGDGMNDAPVLMEADIGVAMGGLGSDAAIEASDMVIMDDDIIRIPDAIRIARFTRRVVFQNIFFALSLKGAFLLLGAAGVASMWVAVIGDVGVALLALLNATRILRHKLT